MELGVTLIISVSMALIFMEHEFKVVAIRKLPLIPLSYNVVIHCVDWSEYSVNRDGLSYDDALLLYQRIHDDLADSSLVLVELCYDGDCSPNYRTFVKSNIMHVSVVEV